jgi:ATP-dependent exoDNAse (exonuclease V) beta subunit
VIGHTSEDAWNGVLGRFGGGAALPLISRLSAGSMLEWMMMAVAGGGLAAPSAAGLPPVHVATHAAQAESLPTSEANVQAVSDSGTLTAEDRRWVERSCAAAGTQLDTSLADMPAVLSVSAAKRQAAASSVEDAPRTIERVAALTEPAFARAEGGEDGLRVGNAYHRFMQFVDLTRLGSAAELTAEVERLVAGGELSAEEAALLELDDFVWLAGSGEGRQLAECAGACRREVPFVYGLPIAGGAERVVLRGIIDCLVETDEGLLIFDYKTDRMGPTGGGSDAWERRAAGYSLQLQLYATAAAEVFEQPVVAMALLFLRERRVEPVSSHSGAIDALLARL